MDSERELKRLRTSLLSRLDDLEKKAQQPIAEDRVRRGSVGQFAADVAREARDLGGRLLRYLEAPSAVATRLAEALTSSTADERGVDDELRVALADVLRPFSRGWLGLRVRTEAPLPQRGGTLVALNRSAWPLPTEGMLVASAIAERARRRDVYVLWDASVIDVRGYGALCRRVGVLPATPGEARRLLERKAMVVCFPEGAAARRRSYAQRYALDDFDDAFVVTEAVRARADVLPAAIVGSEESFPVLGQVAGVPLTPIFPLTGVLGLVPLPLGWRVHVDAPIAYGSDDVTAPWETSDDEQLAERLRMRMQSLLNEQVRARHSIVRG